MKTKLEHRYLLQKAIRLIEDSLDPQTTSDPKIISTRLLVAGDYCKDAAETLKKSVGEDTEQNLGLKLFNAWM